MHIYHIYMILSYDIINCRFIKFIPYYHESSVIFVELRAKDSEPKYTRVLFRYIEH